MRVTISLFHFQLFEIPFYVALDHKYRNIVVSIRGSLSVEVKLVNFLLLTEINNKMLQTSN